MLGRGGPPHCGKEPAERLPQGLLAGEAGVSVGDGVHARRRGPGLVTCPMEGFCEHAVRRALGIPSSQAVVLVVTVGYADNSALKKTRLPLDG